MARLWSDKPPWPAPPSPLEFSACNPITGAESMAYWCSSMLSLGGVRHLSGLSHVIFLSGLALCRGRDLCGQYSALSQDGKLVVEDIPLAVWGLCFGKVGGVISCLFGPVRGYRRIGPQCLPSLLSQPPVFMLSSLCVRGLGSVCYIRSISPVLSSVLCEFKCALTNSLFLSFFLSLGGPEP